MIVKTATLLARIYGHKLDDPLTYPTGVAFSGRLRLSRITGDTKAVANSIARLAESFCNDPSIIPDAAPCLAAGCFADELYAISEEEPYRKLLTNLATRIKTDSDIRVEDFFFSGTLLGRAYKLSKNTKFAEKLTEYLISIDTQQKNGLFWHSHASPFFWGRGNAFAAMGFAEALKYLGEYPSRNSLLEIHLKHLNALRQYRHESGMWHQIIDNSNTYLEHSATTMIGYSIAQGILGGWLDKSEWFPFLKEIWAGVAARISSAGELEKVCVGTGPLDSIEDYINRPFNNGLDDRGGAMALWLATSMLELGAKTEDIL